MGGQLIAELDASGNNRVAEYVYYPGATDAPLALVTGAVGAHVIHYYQQDATGNVLGTFSSSGAVEQTLQYDPWGQVEQASSSLSDTTRLRWKGLLWQGDIAQLYYVRARWYDPVSRRFVSEDPLGLAAGMNQYAFGSGDPINRRDPSGQCGTPDGSVNGGIFAWDLVEGVIECGRDPNDSTTAKDSSSTPSDTTNSNCTQMNVCLTGQTNCTQVGTCPTPPGPVQPLPSCTQVAYAEAGPLYSFRSGTTTLGTATVGAARAGAKGGIVGAAIGAAVNFFVWSTLMDSGLKTCLAGRGLYSPLLSAYPVP